MVLSCESTFHAFFVIYFLLTGWIRAYYTGFASATGERVYTFEEGLILRRVRYTLGLPVIVGSFLYVVNPYLMFWSQWEQLPPSLRWLGVLICGSGLCLYFSTHHHLGKNFTNSVYVRKNAQLVITGPYRFIRHPMYVSALLLCLGASLIAANWFIALLGLSLLLSIMVFRTPIEEKKLLSHYGDAYRLYMEKTGRFFPKMF